MTFTIRSATPDDIETVATVWFAGWADGHAGHVPDALVQHRRYENFRALVPTRICDTTVVEVDDAGVVGFTTVIDDQVEQIYVKREARGTGASTTLLDHAESIIAQNHQVAWLAVVAGNTRARRFYERNGWHDAGPLDYMAETQHGRMPVPTRRYEKRLRSQHLKSPDVRSSRKEPELSYPEHLYTGEGGESTTWHRPFDAAPDIVYPNGNTTHYLVTGDRSDGLLGMYRRDMGPEPAGPGPHFHRSFSESFYILLGSVRVFDGDKWIDTQPGDYVYAPPGGVHGFRNESGEPASMLILFAPGAPREAYFEGLLNLSELTANEQADFMTYHDNHWVEIE